MKLKKRLPFLAMIYISMMMVAFPAEKLPPNVKKGFDSIQPTDAYNICKTLASPHFAGRLTGHEGFTAAEKGALLSAHAWANR